MIQEIVKQVFDQVPTSVKSVGGGCINEASYVQLLDKDIFIKTNLVDLEMMFQKEAKGLELLSEVNHVKIPKVISTGRTEDCSYLILEWIENGRSSTSSYEQLGEELANLHLNSRNEMFGLDHHNWIGSLEQKNDFFSSWDEFMIVNRYEVLLRQALSEELISRDEVRFFEKLYRELNTLIPEEKPSLLHGDLWNGNVIYDQKGVPVLIDPAVYFGHREMDIAMTKLFGGFDEEFYRSYNEKYPMEKGWEERIKINQLYPLLVHLVLFGRSYWNDIKMTVSKYI